ncbi:MAG: hypothetical protein ABH829_03315 [archaeon]
MVKMHTKKVSYLSFLILLVGILFISGCVQQQAQAPQQEQQQALASQDTTTAQSEQESSKFTMNMLYNYGLLSEFEYKIISNAGGQQNVMDIKYKISSDAANGNAAWLQQSDLSVEGNVITTKMWLDKESLACLKISTVMNVAGQTIQQEGQCPTEGPNSASATEAPVLRYIGKESMTVPAGTFSAKKYESESANFWIADNVPLPLKVSYGGEAAMVMELVSYK